MTKIIQLSFLIHRKYFHILNWNLPFLVALRTELPLCNWLNLSLSMIFRRGHILSLFCQSVGVYLCHGMVYQPYSDHLPGQIHPEHRSHSLPGTNRFSAPGHTIPFSGLQSPFLDPKMQTVHVWQWLLRVVNRSLKLRPVEHHPALPLKWVGCLLLCLFFFKFNMSWHLRNEPVLQLHSKSTG